MNFNDSEIEVPFKFKSLICFDDDDIIFKICLEFIDELEDKFIVEMFSNDNYERWNINPNNKNILFNCDLKSSYFFRIQVIDNQNGYLYYGFYQFDIDSIPNNIKNYFVNNSKVYKEGLSMFIKENLSKHNYKDFINQQYEFISNNNNKNKSTLINKLPSLSDSDNESDKVENDTHTVKKEDIDEDNSDDESISISEKAESSDDDCVDFS